MEAEEFEALGTRLMEPDAVATFVAEFTAEWNRLSAESGGQVSLRRRDLDLVKHQLNGLIDAIGDGLRAPGLQGRLDGLGARREALRAELAGLEAHQSAPRLHPGLAQVCWDRVAGPETAMAATQALRELIEAIQVFPGERRGLVSLTLVGDLAAFLHAGDAAQTDGSAAVLLAQNGETPVTCWGYGRFGRVLGSLDAGTGNRRRQYITASV